MATCGTAMAGRAMPDIIAPLGAPLPLPCAEARAGRAAREAAKIRKRRMMSTWVPGPPGLSCMYMYKDAPGVRGVSRGLV
jgi:hypothetical protein